MEDQLEVLPTPTQDGLRAVIRQKLVDSIARPLPALTQRDTWLPAVSNKAIAVIGMRRAGKTSLLWQIMAKRLRDGLPREALVYFSFEDERLSQMTAQDLQLVLEEYFKLYPERRDRDKTVFLLDEIQLISGWESFVRRILDTETIELYLSGSSAKLLSREIATSMRGRALEAIVTPFSFREMLRHHDALPQQPPRNGRKRSALPCKIVLLNIWRMAAFQKCRACLMRAKPASEPRCSAAMSMWCCCAM